MIELTIVLSAFALAALGRCLKRRLYEQRIAPQIRRFLSEPDRKHWPK